MDKKLDLIDTERVIDPHDTVEKAKNLIQELNFRISFEIENLDGLYISTLRLHNQAELKVKFSKMYDFETFPAQGKGLSEIQSKASCLMELFERLTICQLLNETEVTDAINLKTNEIEKVEFDVRGFRSKSFAAGNTVKEATLHALTEEIEHLTLYSPRIFGSDPISIIDISGMDLPDWVKESFFIFNFPHFIDNIHHMQAIRYPKYPDIKLTELKKVEGVWRFHSLCNYVNLKNSSMSASLNPEKAIYRAIMEVLQRGSKEKYSAKKNNLDWPTISVEDLKNNETESIDRDIQLLLNSLNEDNQVFSVDVTSPDFNIPVIKIISDIHKEKEGVFSNSHLAKTLFSID